MRSSNIEVRSVLSTHRKNSCDYTRVESRRVGLEARLELVHELLRDAISDAKMQSIEHRVRRRVLRDEPGHVK